MELKEKFEFIERVADVKVWEEKTTHILYLGEKPKLVAMKEKVNDTFFEVKKFLKMVSKSEVEIDFTCSPVDSIDDLNEITADLFELMKKCTKLMSIEGISYLVEVNLSYDLELFISGEVKEGLKSVKSLQEKVPVSDRLRTTPRLYGKNGMWKNFVVKCELEKFKISEKTKSRGLEL
ncbi:hypothetical protein [Halobacteriovorax sp. JY17]|uniref:hypothetical protein n=1 Tax=Halobacteriovorax sp. JY17 TaxID=2014617 RepID=UPI000C4B285A|nr:hypothetical protein [Halobacteriovorax sp. JY17]PIK14826.1 MAG: hypothetical protein CES88_10850 [Halobacteriovorax sp. JY17]